MVSRCHATVLLRYYVTSIQRSAVMAGLSRMQLRSSPSPCQVTSVAKWPCCRDWSPSAGNATHPGVPGFAGKFIVGPLDQMHCQLSSHPGDVLGQGGREGGTGSEAHSCPPATPHHTRKKERLRHFGAWVWVGKQCRMRHTAAAAPLPCHTTQLLPPSPFSPTHLAPVRPSGWISS